MDDKKTYVVGMTKEPGGVGSIIKFMCSSGLYEEQASSVTVYNSSYSGELGLSHWCGDESVQPILHMSAMVYKSVSTGRLQDIINDPFQFVSPA
jgi:hypothetical protein